MAFVFNPFTGTLDIDTSYSNIVATKANIMARTGDAQGQLAFATDTLELYISNGDNTWNKQPFKFVLEPAAPDMGYTQDSSVIGYGDDYVSDKLLANVDIGNSADTSHASANRMPIRASNGQFQVYANSQWNNIVVGFTFRMDSSFGYTLEYLPTGFTDYIEIMSGNSLNNLGLNGLPIYQNYKSSVGAYPYPVQIQGRSFN